MRTSRWTILLSLPFILLVIPFFLGAPGAHPATDDFTFALYTHRTFVKTGSLLHVLKDALSYTLRTYRDWQGTMTGIFVMALNPAVFSLPHYWIHVPILLLLRLVAYALFLRHFLSVRIGLSSSVWKSIYFVLATISLVFLPDMVEGIYWFNGAWFYTGTEAIALLTLTFCDHVADSRANDRHHIKSVCCFLLLLFIGLNNYITAMMTLVSLFCLAGERFSGMRKRKTDAYAFRQTALFLLPILLGLFLSVIAPGNNVRMETDGAHESGIGWLLKTAGWTMGSALFYTGRFLVKTPLLALLLFLVPELVQTDALRNLRNGAVSPAIACLGYYLILCGMIFPHMYSSGYAGSGRVINMYHDYVLLALPLLLCLCIPRRVPHILESRLFWRILAGIALVLCVFLGQGKNYAKLVSDQMTGVQQAYIRQFKNEYAILDAADSDTDVIVPAWTVQTMTGKPTIYQDPTVWTNESCAAYFDVKSVRAEESTTIQP